MQALKAGAAILGVLGAYVVVFQTRSKQQSKKQDLTEQEEDAAVEKWKKVQAIEWRPFLLRKEKEMKKLGFSEKEIEYLKLYDGWQHFVISSLKLKGTADMMKHEMDLHEREFINPNAAQKRLLKEFGRFCDHNKKWLKAFCKDENEQREFLRSHGYKEEEMEFVILYINNFVTVTYKEYE